MFYKTFSKWCCLVTTVCLLAARCSGDDACSSAPCQNGAQCIPTADTFHCLCVAGYTGPTCSQEEDPCTVVPCQHNGICNSTTNVPGQSSCTYPAENNGQNPCDNTPCQNGDTCLYDAVTSPDQYVCLRHLSPPGGGPNLATPPSPPAGK